MSSYHLQTNQVYIIIIAYIVAANIYTLFEYDARVIIYVGASFQSRQRALVKY